MARTKRKQKMIDERMFFFAYTNTETPKMLNDQRHIFTQLAEKR